MYKMIYIYINIGSSRYVQWGKLRPLLWAKRRRSEATRRNVTAEERRSEAATGGVHGTHQGLGGAKEEETLEGGEPSL